MIHKIMSFGRCFDQRISYVFGGSGHAHDVKRCDVVAFGLIIPPVSVFRRDSVPLGSDDIDFIVGQFDEFAGKYQQKTAREVTPVFHAVISVHPLESLTPIKWEYVVHRYLEALGYSNCQFIAVRHRDCEHEHVHIVCSRVYKSEKGYQLVQSSGDRAAGIKILREIEEELDIRVVANPWATPGVDVVRYKFRHTNNTSNPPWRGILAMLVVEAAQKSRQRSWAYFIQICESEQITVQTYFDGSDRPIGVTFGYKGKFISGRKLKNCLTSFPKLTGIGQISFNHASDFLASIAANERHAAACIGSVAGDVEPNLPAGVAGEIFHVMVSLNLDQLQRLDRHSLTIQQSRYLKNSASICLCFKADRNIFDYTRTTREGVELRENAKLLIRVLLSVLLGVLTVAVGFFKTTCSYAVNMIDVSKVPKLHDDISSYLKCVEEALGKSDWKVSESELIEGVHKFYEFSSTERKRLRKHFSPFDDKPSYY